MLKHTFLSSTSRKSHSENKHHASAETDPGSNSWTRTSTSNSSEIHWTSSNATGHTSSTSVRVGDNNTANYRGNRSPGNRVCREDYITQHAVAETR